MPGQPIRVHPENSRYFLYDGKPIVLVTPTEHYGAVINRNFDYVCYLDDVAEKGITLSRIFPCYREYEQLPQNRHCPLKPTPVEFVALYARTGPGYAIDGFPKFDLDRWDDEYFQRLHGFLSEAARRGVVVELSLFSRIYSVPNWSLQPFFAGNNVQGVGTGEWPEYTSLADPALVERQKAYVRKIVQEVNSYDNIYFEVCNEPLGDATATTTTPDVEAWQDAIRAVIREEEARLPKRHMVFQQPVESAHGGSDLDPLVDNEDVDGITLHDYHQLRFRDEAFHPFSRWAAGDLKLANIIRLFTHCQDLGKPLVFDEDNASSHTLDEPGWTIHRKRAWTAICSGSHYDMPDFSIQASGGEAGTPASRALYRSPMGYLSRFIHSLDFIHMAPIEHFCSQVPPATVAATLANPGQEYVIYVADAREQNEPGRGEPCGGALAFALPAGAYQARFFSPVSGQYADKVVALAGGDASLQLDPFTHDTVVHITRGA